MRFPSPLSVASKIAAPVAEMFHSMTGPGAGRRVSATDGLTHIEMRGIHRPGTEGVAEELRRRLLQLDGIRAVEVNAVLGRVVVGHDRAAIGNEQVAAVVGEVERELGLHAQEPAPASAYHPANTAPGLREVVAIATNLVGMGYAVLGKALPLRALPPVVPGLMSLVDSTPRLRAEVENRLGRPLTDAILTVGGAAGQALAQRPIAMLTDAGYRLCLHRETIARQRAWHEWEHSVADRLVAHHAAPLDVPPRPGRLPNGPVERVANTSTTFAIGGYGGVLATGRGPQRAAGLLLAGVPRAAKVGREAFAAQVGRDFSHAGALILQPEALRRLDRVDTVVLEAATLFTGRWAIADIEAVDETADPAEVVQHAHDLVDVDDPETPRHRDGWRVIPATGLMGMLPTGAVRAARERASPGATLLALLHEGRLAGLVSVVLETDPLTDALVEAASHAGVAVLGGTRDGLEHRLGIDRVVPGDDRLPDAVRRLQAEGHVVAVVSADHREALAAADVGIGVPAEPDAVPWGAHVVCRGIGQASLLLEAVRAARVASRNSAALSVAGSSLGALLSVIGPPGTAPARAAFPVHFAGLLALAYGGWSGTEPGRRATPVPLDRTPWHAMSPAAVLDRLTSSPQGLDEKESERRLREHDVRNDPAELGLFRASLDELGGPLTPALAAGAGVSASVGSITDALMISAVLGLNALIGGAQHASASKALHQLLDTSALLVRLRRGGDDRAESADRLVPGDVIELQAGDAVPADCRVLEAEGLELDESSLTGESQLVGKSSRATTARVVAERSSMLYEGSAVGAGRALAVVVATGEQTETGRTVRIGAGATPTTGVAARLQSLTRVTLPVTFGAGIALMAVDLARGRGVTRALSRAVSLSVAAVPEGLPFVATVAELASARRLAERGVLVRSPSTIEALGRVDVLCFDKTGTLTEGRISLQEVSEGRGCRPLPELTPDTRDVLAVAVRASPWDGTEERPLPHPTDRAVLEGARSVGVTPEHDLGPLEWVAELPFEPSRSYHAVLCRSPRGALVSVKGAPEVVLARCTRWRRPDGHGPFDGDARAEVEATVEGLARRGFRVLAVAERAVPDRWELADELVLCGLLALADPVRPAAAEAVDQMRRAGVDIVMITGDHPSTAEAVAAELDVLGGGRVLTGDEVEELDEAELAKVLPQVSVFARVSPAQKAHIVRELRRTGRVVAMTGDGANDVPAIRLAHVGIALGSKATPAAREAAGLVVTDDRIETITDAIVEGRAMWSSVRDALAILLGGNLGEIGFTLGSGLFSPYDTLNARQLLLVNLLTDALPAMAVAVRPPPRTTPEELLAEGPDSSLGRTLTRDISVRAVTTAGAAMAGWTLARPVSTRAQAGTTALATLVSAQLAQTMAVRGRTPLVVAAGAGSLAVLGGIVQTPGLSQFFGCTPLLPHQWGIALGSAAAATGVEVAGRAMVRARRR
jgi:cation-transporting ATPase I